MDCFVSSDLKNLANLLDLENCRDSEDESVENNSSTCNYNLHCMANEMISSQKKITECNKDSPLVEIKNKNIWLDEEVPDEDDDEAIIKETPEYEMVYQQSVTPDDMFLQMSGKSPGSNSCECLLIKIKLPGISTKDAIFLNSSALKLICKTQKHYLNLDLPKNINPLKCTANWNQLQCLLVVKLHFDVNCELQI